MTLKITLGIFLCRKKMPLEINYLIMIGNVKMYLAN
jgi:hypothetical protein